MNTLEIILIIFFLLFLLAFCLFFVFTVIKTKLQFKEAVVKGHREIWTFYCNNCEALKEIFVKDSKQKELTDIQYKFLIMLFNHMEFVVKLTNYKLVARGGKYAKDFSGLMSNYLVKLFWERNQKFRNKSFVKAINKCL